MMWPFKKKPSTPRAPSHEELREKELHARFVVGDRFKYLGVDMVIIRVGQWHATWIMDPLHSFAAFDEYVLAHYVDSNGVVQEMRFNPSQFALIKGRNTHYPPPPSRPPPPPPRRVVTTSPKEDTE